MKKFVILLLAGVTVSLVACNGEAMEENDRILNLPEPYANLSNKVDSQVDSTTLADDLAKSSLAPEKDTAELPSETK